MDKPDVTWMQDGGGVNSCHINGVSLSFLDSLIGRVVMTGVDDEAWHVVLKDGTDLGGFSSMTRARVALESHYRKSVTKPEKLRHPERR